MKKIFYFTFFFVLLAIVFWKLNSKKITLPNDIQSISGELVTLDVQSSPKIIIAVSLLRLNDSLPFIEHIQKEISINRIRINDVFLVVSDATEHNRNEIILFLENNKIFLQMVLDSDRRIAKKIDMNSSTTIYILSKDKLIWETSNMLVLKNTDLKKLIRP